MKPATTASDVESKTAYSRRSLGFFMKLDLQSMLAKCQSYLAMHFHDKEVQLKDQRQCLANSRVRDHPCNIALLDPLSVRSARGKRVLLQM